MPGYQPDDANRVHSESPAEGEEREEEEVRRDHSQEPAEGPDEE